MFDIGSPHTGSDLADAFLALERDGAALSRQFDTAAFFSPQGTAWSPALHIRHLRKATIPISLAMRLPRWILVSAFGTQTAPSRPYSVIVERYRASLARSASAGIFAPRPQPPPADPGAAREAILRAWHAAAAQFAAAVRRWPEPQLDRCRLPHPRLGRLSVREMAAFTVYHTAHHLNRMIERAGPGASRGGQPAA